MNSVDCLLLQTKAALDKKDYAQAAESLANAEKLNVQLSDIFYYHYGRAYACTVKLEQGQVMLERYLTLPGTNRKFYPEVLIEMNRIESAIKKRDAEKNADDCQHRYARAVEHANNMVRKYTKACEADSGHASCEYIQRMIDRNGPQYNDKRIDSMKYWIKELNELDSSSSYKYCLDKYTKPELPSILR